LGLVAGALEVVIQIRYASSRPMAILAASGRVPGRPGPRHFRPDALFLTARTEGAAQPI
jgi:hypothetical protein